MIYQHKYYYNYLGFEAEINSVRSDLTHLQAWKSTVDTKLMNLTPSYTPSGSDVSENEISNIKNEIISIQNDVSELQQKSGHSGSSNSSKGIMPKYKFMLYSKYFMKY